MLENKLENMVLIDDNKVSNFFNKITLMNMSLAKNIEVFDNCLDALGYFTNKDYTEHILGDVIFLDLYTPYMNGWEFLDKLSELTFSAKKIKVVVMHDSNLLPEEEIKLYQYPFVKSITNKHLDTLEVSNLLNGNNVTVKGSVKMSS